MRIRYIGTHWHSRRGFGFKSVTVVHEVPMPEWSDRMFLLADDATGGTVTLSLPGLEYFYEEV